MDVSEGYWFIWCASECSDKGLMSELCYMFELNVTDPAFAQEKNITNEKGFLWRTKHLYENLKLFHCAK